MINMYCVKITEKLRFKLLVGGGVSHRDELDIKNKNISLGGLMLYHVEKRMKWAEYMEWS